MTTHTPIDEPLAAAGAMLPAGGLWLVDTDTDTYEVDVDSRLAVKLNLDREGRGTVGEPEPFMFDTVECVVGGVMLFDAASSPRATDRVLGFTRGEA